MTDAKKTHTISLRRGALYLLEGLLQDFTNANNPSKMMKIGTLWEKVREANERIITTSWAPEGIDFELPIAVAGDDTDQFTVQKRINEASIAQSKWQDESVTLEFSDKNRDLAREVISKAANDKKLSHRNALGSKFNLTLDLLRAFGFGGDEE